MIGAAALVVAATVGAGMFALPYVVHAIGWMPALGYLITLSFLVIYAHTIYARVLLHLGEHRRLPGLARTELGVVFFWPAFLAVFFGVIFALVAYLLLSARFVHLLVPAIPTNVALGLFWVLASFPLLMRLKAFVGVATLGAVMKAGLIIVVLSFVLSAAPLDQLPIVGDTNFVFGFGPMLFALAGWTAVAPIVEYLKRRSGLHRIVSALTLGTIVSALLYASFVLGIAASTQSFTEDAVSGLVNGPAWYVVVLGLLGLFAIWTPCLTGGLEIKDMIKDDLKKPAAVGVAAAIFLPPLLILGGFTSYFFVVSLSGGFLLSIQYLLILLIGRRVLRPRGWSRFMLNLSLGVFFVAALYEAWRFF